MRQVAVEKLQKLHADIIQAAACQLIGEGIRARGGVPPDRDLERLQQQQGMRGAWHPVAVDRPKGQLRGLGLGLGIEYLLQDAERQATAVELTLG